MITKVNYLPVSQPGGSLKSGVINNISWKLPYHLLVADVDGTLAVGGAPVPFELVARLNEFRRRGGLFTLATGKGPQAALPYLQQLSVDIPAILLNGAQIYEYSGDCYLQEHFLPASFTEVFLPWLDESGLDALAYRGKDVFIRAVNPVTAEYLTKENTPYGEVKQWQNLTRLGLHKILIISRSSPFPLFAASHPALAGRVNWVNSESMYWEVLPPGVSKGSALEKLIQFLCLEPEEVVAVGDYLNDLEMISMAGLGVAVANAHPQLQSVAGRVTAGQSWRGVLELLDEICPVQKGF